MNSPARVQLPTFDDVDELPMALRMVVPQGYLDVNNHMNMRYYLALYNDALDPAFTDLGLGTAYPRDHGLSYFQVDNHIRYLAEVHGGNEVSVHMRILGKTAKAVHAMAFLLNRSTGTLANTMEFLMLHVDLRTRKVVDADPGATEELDRRIAADSNLAWPAPTSGCISHGR